MADISSLSRIVAGAVRNVDISANTLVTDSIKVGGVTPTELTKAILDRLISLQNGSDVGSTYHIHDNRYYTESELDAGQLDSRYFTETELQAQTNGASGASKIGVDITPAFTNFTSGNNVQSALEGIDSALGVVAGADKYVKATANDTTSGYLDSKLTAGSGLSKSITNPSGNEVVDLSVNVDDSTIEINSDTLRVKAGGIQNSHIGSAAAISYSKLSLGDSIKNSDVSSVAAIAESKLALDYSTSSLNTAIGTKVSKSGDTMAGNLAMGGNKVTGLGAPTTNGDALRYDQLAANNGIATLDGAGKVPVSQLPNSVMTYEGLWNASTNSPTLADGAGNAGQVYRVSVAGTQNLGSGNITFEVGDYAIYNSSGVFEKADTTDAVSSVNSQTGVVVLNTSHISENTNLYFTDERAQDAVGAALVNSSKVSLTYNDGSASIVADIISGSLVNADINASAAIAYSKLNLASSIVNADVSGSAAIAYSKLNLSASIVNADIASGAAIADSKLATISTANKVSGSAVQLSATPGLQDNSGLEVKLDGSTLSKSGTGLKVADGGITNTQVNASAGIVYSKLSLTDSISNSDVSSVAAIAYSKLNLSNSIVAGDLTSNSVTTVKINNAAVDKDKLATNAFDQDTIIGGAGTSASVSKTPRVAKSMIAGESFAANTAFVVRMALTGETAGRIYKADKDASSSNKYMAIGVVYSGSAISAADPVSVTILGEIQVTAATYAAGDLGKELFVGTSGAIILGASLSNSTNEAAFCMGVAQDTNKIHVDFKQLRGIA